MRWPFTTRKNLEATERAWRETIELAKRSQELCRNAQDKYAKVLDERTTVGQAAVARAEKERDLANLRFSQLATQYHRLQMRHQDYFD